MPRRQKESLMDTFYDFNARFFNGKLPLDTMVSWSRSIPRHVAGDFDGTDIRINVALKPLRPCWKLTLLHEMAHLATSEEVEEHGPKWKREMRRLYRIGAFDTLL